MIASCGLSASWSILAYNSYAVSVLSFVSQFDWVPVFVLGLEKRALAKILHTPMHVLGKWGHALLSQVGVRSCRSVLVSGFVALVRTVVATLRATFDIHATLKKQNSSCNIRSAFLGQLGHYSW